MRLDIDKRKNDILNWIDEGKSKHFICRELKCKHDTLNRRLNKWNITYKGKQNWCKGLKSNKRKSALEYIKTKNPKSYIIKKKLLEDNIKVKKCERCGETKWLNNEIPLELHHIDGNRYNNVLENFELLCPNCHALENNNSGLAMGKYNRNTCKICGTKISSKTKNRMCQICFLKTTDFNRYRKVKDRPPKSQIKKDVENLGYSATGRKYGVTDNAIRKWLK